MGALTTKVLTDAPAFHGDGDAGQTVITHGLSRSALEYLEASLKPGARTLETGSGFSTVVFAGSGARHLAVTPNAFEGQRITGYCEQEGIDVSNLAFAHEPSEEVLPGLDRTPLDLVLIDGSHSFPHTFIDFFYTAHRLEVGGTLIVDDVHLWSGRVIRSFLRSESAWRQVGEFEGRTSAFRKVAASDPDALWTDQPLVVRRSGLRSRARVHQAVSMVRHGEGRRLVQMLREMRGA